MPCSEKQGMDVMLDVIKHDTAYAGPPPCYEPAVKDPAAVDYGASEFGALEVARMIADDRDTRGYESSALIPSLFEVKESGMQDPPSVCLAVHRTTGMVR